MFLKSEKKHKIRILEHWTANAKRIVSYVPNELKNANFVRA